MRASLHEPPIIAVRAGAVAAIPLGIAMGISPIVSSFLTPLFRFFSVLAGIVWIPNATLWFGNSFGAIAFAFFSAVFKP